MKHRDIENHILDASKEALKTYSFKEHDPNLPTGWWFQESEEGLVLFVVLYTQACRWSSCLSCNLPSECSLSKVGFREVIHQIDYLMTLPAITVRAPDIRKIILSNNGSVLDEQTLSSTALMYFVTQINLQWTHVRCFSLETRVDYVDTAELEWMSRALKDTDPPGDLELAIGFESFDDTIRNGALIKGLEKEDFEKLVKRMARYHFRLKCYMMQKPVPGMMDKEALADIKDAIDYFSDLHEKHGVRINMHLNPTYVARGTQLEEAFKAGKYTPPLLQDVIRAVRHAEGKGISVYVGLYDEGLAAVGGSFIRPGDEALVAKLEQFNRTGDFGVLA